MSSGFPENRNRKLVNAELITVDLLHHNLPGDNVNLEQVVAGLIQKVEHRFYGKYRGFVVDNTDPEQLGRLKVRVPSVLGNEIVTGWALPCTPYGGAANQGFLFIPEVDAGVWVEFEEGDLEFPLWVGTFWSKPGGESELPKLNDAEGAEGAVQDPPTRKIIKTLKGHTIQFEDKDEEEMVLMTSFVGEEKTHVLILNKDGIKITDGANKNVIAMTADGIKLTDATGNVIEMKTDAFNLTAKVPFTIDASGQPVVVKAQTIDFNKA